MSEASSPGGSFSFPARKCQTATIMVVGSLTAIDFLVVLGRVGKGQEPRALI